MKMSVWINSAFERIYPNSLPTGERPLLFGACNEKQAFQVSFRWFENINSTVEVTAKLRLPKGLTGRIRKVEYVLMPHFNPPYLDNQEDTEGVGHLPGLVPDPLIDGDTIVAGPAETRSFWININPSALAKPGNYKIQIELEIKTIEKNCKKSLSVPLRLYALKLKPRKNFSVTHWFYNDALIAWYKTNMFDKKFWAILPNYIKNVVEHGQDTLYVPAFTPALDGDKVPSQLVKIKKIGENKYYFDFSDVSKYIEIARKCGIKKFEFCHLFSQWGASKAIKIYHGQGKGLKLLWASDTEATSLTYRKFLEQYLSELKKFLSSHKLLKKCFFHISDEPPLKDMENYRKCREMLLEIAPWMQIMDAISDIEFVKHKLIDIPIPNIAKAPTFIQENIDCWCYYFCGMRHKLMNHLLDTPLTKIAMHGMLFYCLGVKGFLHWGYNFWYRRGTTDLLDPFTETAGGFWPVWPYGDTFLVYPGLDGPIDSIRWEVFGLSMQDFRLLQTLGIDRSCFKEVKDFANFPKTLRWRNQLRRKLLTSAL